MSTFIPMDFDAAQEPQPAPSGDYALQITKAEIKESGPNSKRPGSPQLVVTVGFTEEPNVPNITQFISLPHEEDDAKSALFKTLLVKRFLAAFKVSHASNGLDLDEIVLELPGHTAVLGVKLDEPDDNGNIYNRLIVPRMKGESEGQGRARPPSR